MVKFDLSLIRPIDWYPISSYGAHFDIQYWSNSNIEDGVYPRVWVPDAGGEVAGPDLAADSVPAGPDEFSGTPYAYIRTHFGLGFQ